MIYDRDQGHMQSKATQMPTGRIPGNPLHSLEFSNRNFS